MTRLINEQGDNTLGYDDLGRLSSRAPAGGGGPTLSWTYDRFGNRLSQTAAGSGSGSFPQPVTDVSPYSNKVNGYTYDLAGNLLNDGVHTYTYDQEGNLIYVDNGYTTWDNYDALNRRIMHVTGNFTNYKRYEYGLDGSVTDVWQDEGVYENLSRYYGPKGDSFAYWTLAGGAVHYQHTDYLGTVKIRTDPNHNTEAAYSDLPFGERTGTAGTDDNTEHYALLDTDSESDTHHAQFRTYEPRIGRWLQPDPYAGSYDGNDPQSWNRYNYALNDPASLLDPSGLFECGSACYSFFLGQWWLQNYYGINYAAGLFAQMRGITSQSSTSNQSQPPNAPSKPTKLTPAQCSAARTVLAREAQYGTPKAARMSGNTFGDNTLSPFNSTYVPNLQSPVGEIDLDWFTDISGYGGGQYTNAIVYTGAKTLWTVGRVLNKLPVGNYLPFADPGERNAVFQSTIGTSYSDIFTPSYLQQACGGH